ncbi:MAG: hypothetical protein OHK0052_18540 [Anaerolineales bacterium]
MNRKVITFLGIKPRDAVYEWKGKTYPAKVTAQAIREFAQFDEMLVLVTPDAKTQTFPLLAHLGDDRILPIDIVDGKDTESMWEIFQTVVDNVDEDETVIFDITHGFRSLPFLAFLFIAYLKSAKNVTIEAVYYGAWEMQKDGVTPILDLTEFVTMLDWLTAVNEFVYTGNARYLAQELNIREQPQLRPLAENVSEISLGLELLRPRDVAKASQEISQHLESASDILPKPFGVVAQSLKTAYTQFGLQNSNDAKEHLRVQLRMIKWYCEKQQFVHTLSMAREWLVSLLCVEFNLDLWDKNCREEMEFLLNGGVRKENVVIIKESPYLEVWKQKQYRKRLNRLWCGEPYELANLRNDVLHSGFRKNPELAAAIVTQIEKIVNEVNEIAKIWGLV